MTKTIIMEKKNAKVLFNSDYIIETIIVDYGKLSFVVHITGYKEVEVLFLEIESFIAEYDKKLHLYLQNFIGIENKIIEAIDIGYNFGPMVAELLKSFIEYGIIQLSKIETK